MHVIFQPLLSSKVSRGHDLLNIMCCAGKKCKGLDFNLLIQLLHRELLWS